MTIQEEKDLKMSNGGVFLHVCHCGGHPLRETRMDDDVQLSWVTCKKCGITTDVRENNEDIKVWNNCFEPFFCSYCHDEPIGGFHGD